MPEPAYLVEGLMEKKIVQKICPGKVIRQIGCNGKGVPMSVVATFVEKQVSILSNRHFPIVILLDREQRKKDCDELIEELIVELTNRGIALDQIVVGMPDRCFETWIVADAGHVLGSPNLDAEGKMGKPIVTRLLGKDIFYHEATVGVDLFLKARPSEMYQNSPSFKRFVDALTVDCDWKKKCFA